MPKNTNILMIRHAEKPESGKRLAVSGQARAQAYVIYFQNYTIQSSTINLNYLFASKDSSGSDRPDLTIKPLATAIGLSIDTKHKDKDYTKLADDILKKKKYDNSDILICWHHEEILNLANDLGVVASKLPPGANWPSHWPGGEYGWLLQLCYDGKGNINDSQTMCINEKLMYDDQNDPPGVPQ